MHPPNNLEACPSAPRAGAVVWGARRPPGQAVHKSPPPPPHGPQLGELSLVYFTFKGAMEGFILK